MVFTLFVFILVTNLIGYIPLPVDSAAEVQAVRREHPAFQIYAADTNVAVPLLLALGVFFAFNVEGIKRHGFRGYIKSLVPAGVGRAMLILIFPLEIVSNFLRLLSLTIRLWANLLAGHLLIEFMAGDLAVLARPAAAGLDHAALRGRHLPVRGGADRGTPGLHLCHSDRHLSRWRRLPSH